MRRVDDGGNIRGIGSATLIVYRERRFLLTAQHVVSLDSNDWVLELGHLPGKGTSIYRPRGFQYIAELNRTTGELRTIDFCYCEVPADLNSTYQERSFVVAGEERPRHVFETTLDSLPCLEEVYAFAGEVKPEQHGPTTFATEMNVYGGLRYVRTEGELHIFKLPVAHPGHTHFKGCSGAPVVDRKRQVVALVCNGDEDEGIVRAVSLARYKFALEAYCGVFGAA